MFLLVTPCTRLVASAGDKMSIEKVVALLCCCILMSSAIAVRKTVANFRNMYRPLVVQHLGAGNWEFTRTPSAKHEMLIPMQHMAGQPKFSN